MEKKYRKLYESTKKALRELSQDTSYWSTRDALISHLNNEWDKFSKKQQEHFFIK